MTPGRPVFVVGLARSGTTLMAVCLDRHPAFDCGPETHLLAVLETPEGARALQAAHWPDAAVDLVCSVVEEGHLVHEAAGVEREQVRTFLAGRDPSVAAVVESLTVPQAEAAGKRRWVEKTPRHLARIGTIRATWPDASIIRMVRDPRARAVSVSESAFSAQSQVRALLDGTRREARARPDVEADRRLLSVRLEDLVLEPERELGRVCAFLDEAWDPAMLDTSLDATAITGDASWKQRAARPIDRADPEAWRSRMAPSVARLAALYCREELERDGYPGARAIRATVMVVPRARRIAAAHEGLLVGLAASDIVVAPTADLRLSALRSADGVAWYPTERRSTPRHHGPTGWRAASAALLDLTMRRVRRRPAVRIIGPDHAATATGSATTSERVARRRGRRGMPERMLSLAIASLARTATLDQAPEVIAASVGVVSSGWPSEDDRSAEGPGGPS